VDIIRLLRDFEPALLVNVKDKTGWTPLYCASHHGHKAAVSCLLTELSGVDVSAATLTGKTPLHAAAGQGRSAVADLLLAAGASAAAVCAQGRTPMHEAAMCGHQNLYTLLCKAVGGAEDIINLKDMMGYTASDYFNMCG